MTDTSASAGVTTVAGGMASAGADGRFSLDARSGTVRVAASVARDAGRVFGLDVKATDRGGADDGKSAIINLFVSSLAKFNNRPILYC